MKCSSVIFCFTIMWVPISLVFIGVLSSSCFYSMLTIKKLNVENYKLADGVNILYLNGNLNEEQLYSVEQSNYYKIAMKRVKEVNLDFDIIEAIITKIKNYCEYLLSILKKVDEERVTIPNANYNGKWRKTAFPLTPEEMEDLDYMNNELY